MSQEMKIVVQEFNAYYGSSHVLRNVNLKIRPQEIFVIFGPA